VGQYSPEPLTGHQDHELRVGTPRIPDVRVQAADLPLVVLLEVAIEIRIAPHELRIRPDTGQFLHSLTSDVEIPGVGAAGSRAKDHVAAGVPRSAAHDHGLRVREV